MKRMLRWVRELRDVLNLQPRIGKSWGSVSYSPLARKDSPRCCLDGHCSPSGTIIPEPDTAFTCRVLRDLMGDTTKLRASPLPPRQRLDSGEKPSPSLHATSRAEPLRPCTPGWFDNPSSSLLFA